MKVGDKVEITTSAFGTQGLTGTIVEWSETLTHDFLIETTDGNEIWYMIEQFKPLETESRYAAPTEAEKAQEEIDLRIEKEVQFAREIVEANNKLLADAIKEIETLKSTIGKFTEAMNLSETLISNLEISDDLGRWRKEVCKIFGVAEDVRPW